MKRKIYALGILLLVIIISLLVVILPTFFTKGFSRISLQQKLELPLVLNDSKDIKLVFFGYSGCVDICTPRLQAISKFYNTLDEETKEKLGVEFLDISTPGDKTLPQSFASYFHKDFKGIYLEKTILREYTRAFNVYFAQSLMDTTEFDHTSNLYLIKKNKDTKELRFIYTAYPFDFKQIKLDIKELRNERSN